MREYSDKHKHLEFLQAAINRMAGNLFLLKGWTVTLIAALFALAAKDANPLYAAIAYFPLFVFWTLDGYFLSQERCFRALYDHVRRLDETQSISLWIPAHLRPCGETRGPVQCFRRRCSCTMYSSRNKLYKFKPMAGWCSSIHHETRSVLCELYRVHHQSRVCLSRRCWYPSPPQFLGLLVWWWQQSN